MLIYFFSLLLLFLSSSLGASINSVISYFVCPNPENPWELRVGSVLWRRHPISSQRIVTTLPNLQGQDLLNADEYHFETNSGFDGSIMKYFDKIAIEFRTTQIRYFFDIVRLLDPVPLQSLSFTFANVSLFYPATIFRLDTTFHSLINNYEGNFYLMPRSCLRVFVGYRKFKMNEAFRILFVSDGPDSTINMLTKNLFEGAQVGCQLHCHLTPQVYLSGIVKMARGTMSSQKNLSGVFNVNGVASPATTLGDEQEGAFLGEIAAGLGFEFTCNMAVEGCFSALRMTRVADPFRQYPVTNVNFGTVTTRDPVDQSAKLTVWGVTVQAIFYW